MRRGLLHHERPSQPSSGESDRTHDSWGRIARIATLAASGGFVFQAVGCATGLTPVFLSLVESAILSLLLSGLAVP